MTWWEIVLCVLGGIAALYVVVMLGVIIVVTAIMSIFN